MLILIDSLFARGIRFIFKSWLSSNGSRDFSLGRPGLLLPTNSRFPFPPRAFTQQDRSYTDKIINLNKLLFRIYLGLSALPSSTFLLHRGRAMPDKPPPSYSSSTWYNGSQKQGLIFYMVFCSNMSFFTSLSFLLIQFSFFSS